MQMRISRLEMDLLESREEVSSLRGLIRKFQEESQGRAGSDELVTTTLDSYGAHIKRFDAILSGQQGYQSSRAFGKTPAAPSSSRPLPPSPGVFASMHAPPPAPTPFPAPSANLAIGKDPTMNNPTPFNGKEENVKIFLDGLMIKYHYMPQTHQDDQSRISDALSLIAENSNTTYWKSTIMSKLARHLRDPSEPLLFANWNDFEKNFCKFFGIIDERGASQAQLK